MKQRDTSPPDLSLDVSVLINIEVLMGQDALYTLILCSIGTAGKQATDWVAEERDREQWSCSAQTIVGSSLGNVHPYSAVHSWLSE